jgi:hypothetical protein
MPLFFYTISGLCSEISNGRNRQNNTLFLSSPSHAFGVVPESGDLMGKPDETPKRSSVHLPLSHPSAPSFPPPKGVCWRTFSSNNCRLFGLKQVIIAYFKIACRKVSFCAPCYVPKHLISPKEARIDPGMGGTEYPPKGCKKTQDHTSSDGVSTTISRSGDVS